MHSCPDCGKACYCHGDIDDTEVEMPEFSASNCDCCEGRYDGGDEDYDGREAEPCDCPNCDYEATGDGNRLCSYCRENGCSVAQSGAGGTAHAPPPGGGSPS